MVEIPVPQRLANAAPRRAHPERVSWSAAVGAGCVGGAALLVFLIVSAVAIYGEPPLRLLALIAATVRGEALLAGPATPSVLALGALLHFALSLLYALAFAGITAELPRWSLAWAGLAFGIALYFANLHGFTHLFPWFAELRTADTLVAHAAFGLLLARAYCELAPGR